MKKLYSVILSAAMVFVSSCTKPTSPAGESAAFSSPTTSADAVVSDETQAAQPPGPQDEYISLVESYIDNAVFRPADESRVRELSELLQGHYDITGRTDGGGLEYYVAVRRGDAPVYGDFTSVSLLYFTGPDTDGEELRLGYYDTQGEEVPLYRLGGYTVLDMPDGYDTLNSFCFGLSGAQRRTDNLSFRYAFDEVGRATLDFLKSKPGLSPFDESSPSIWFFYQNDDTVKFYSEPYPCQIKLEETKANDIRGLLSSSESADGITTYQDARNYMRKKSRSGQPTGAYLIIDDRQYELLGNHETPGYMMVSSRTEYEFLSLVHNEELYRLVMKEIKDVVGTDYASFDPEWFKVPLASASITFPESMIPADSDDEAFTHEVRTQTIEDRGKLDALSEMMDRAINDPNPYYFSKCPYSAPIDFLRGDGETLRIYAAVDSCDSMAYEGRIGFEYGAQRDLAAIFDEAMFYRLEQ